MFIQIAPKARVYVTDLTPEDADRAKVLADKAVFVRKKLDAGMQYALNRKIRFVAHDGKK